MNKTIIFDFDGTIANSEKIIIDIYNEIARERGLAEMSESDIEYLRGQCARGKCKALNVSVRKLPFLFVDLRKRYRARAGELELNDGMKDVIHKLHDLGFKQAIVSSNEEPVIRNFLNDKGICMLDDIFSSKNLFNKHRVIKRFIRKNGLDKKDIIYVGDEVRDIVASKKAGIKVIAVTWGYDSRDLLERAGADFIINAPEEICEIAGIGDEKCGEVSW